MQNDRAKCVLCGIPMIGGGNNAVINGKLVCRCCAEEIVRQLKLDFTKCDGTWTKVGSRKVDGIVIGLWEHKWK